MSLSYDIHRCSGNGQAVCKNCRRREPGDPVQQWAISPAANECGCVDYYPPILAHTSIEGMDDMAESMGFLPRIPGHG